MTGVRVLVGTRKGAFVLTADGSRRDWTVDGPFFGGWEIYHVAGSPADPDRIWASQSGGWFGQQVQRSDDGGRTWAAVGNEFAYATVPGTHQWYDGTPHPWEFARVWNLTPSATDPDTVLAGVEDAALFRSVDGGGTWTELPGLREHGSGPQWQPGAGGLCLHTILPDPGDDARMLVAISAAGVFRTDDGGKSWRATNRGLVSEGIPDPDAEVGHCVHKLALHPARPETVYMQKHWDVMRSDDFGEHWHDIGGDLPTDFGFVVDVHAHDPDTVYVVPITSDAEHYPPEGRLRVYRSRTGGNEWEPLTEGLPQQHCYVDVLRDAMAVDRLDECGVYVGTTGGQVYASADAGGTWAPIVRDLPAVLSVQAQTLP
ncbi:MAG: GH74 [uncultured Pseudonocardia sp.]|uniref:GH74 n=1 Tax=uncultured Pseudonocardia sp. TaxID=211455 RepID=A0A6J4NNM8_9PSEU|nr:MAG: GH74 [uncultured Pseudonocardia sp.]